MASRGQRAQIAQADYHRALATHYPDLVEIIKGYHTLEYANLPRYQHPLNRSDRLGDKVTIGIVIPMAKPQPGKHHRPPNERLSKLADWTRRYILDSELTEAQLPEKIPTRKKPIRKPEYW